MDSAETRACLVPSVESWYPLRSTLCEFRPALVADQSNRWNTKLSLSLRVRCIPIAAVIFSRFNVRGVGCHRCHVDVHITKQWQACKQSMQFVI